MPAPKMTAKQKADLGPIPALYHRDWTSPPNPDAYTREPRCAIVGPCLTGAHVGPCLTGAHVGPCLTGAIVLTPAPEPDPDADPGGQRIALDEPTVALAGVTVIAADGTTTGNLMTDDSIRLDEPTL